MSKADAQIILFVSDTHFHLEPPADETERLALFLDFLDMARGADELVLLGDVFDFWFDYPHFRLKGYESLLSALGRVRDAGVALQFIGGNHDVWAADYMHRRYGCVPAGDALDLERQGRRLHLTHGDGLLLRDRPYQAFRWLVRQPPAVFFAKIWHPELLYAFSRSLSHTSRKAKRDEAVVIERRAESYLASAHDDWDLMLMGHLHHPFRIERDGRVFAALGSWFGEASYGMMRGGRFELLDFAADPHPL